MYYLFILMQKETWPFSYSGPPEQNDKERIIIREVSWSHEFKRNVINVAERT